MPKRFSAGMKAVLVAGILALGACAQATTTGTPQDGAMTNASSKNPLARFKMRWDHHERSDRWNQSAVNALRTHGSALPDFVPEDIEAWCPGYTTASREEREAFWVGLISALAKHESTWNPKAVGGSGSWFGLVQISPRTAQGYNCRATSGAELTSGADNVSCAIRIMSHTVQRDGVVSRGMRGVAADWGPFHSASKREDMSAWTRAQPFCQPKGKGRMAALRGG
ncbi:MAG: transglycosylase SLT domain-containing protein [Tropicimonas sp.]|uniref:transglycosylase SLT domain-containing protein n=1 Tax=Tropicimonas sp. TaxID=2067044 RepID=UPI003A8AD995